MNSRFSMSRRFAQIAARKSSIGPFSAAATDYSPQLAVIGVSDFAPVVIPAAPPGQENFDKSDESSVKKSAPIVNRTRAKSQVAGLKRISDAEMFALQTHRESDLNDDQPVFAPPRPRTSTSSIANSEVDVDLNATVPPHTRSLKRISSEFMFMKRNPANAEPTKDDGSLTAFPSVLRSSIQNMVPRQSTMHVNVSASKLGPQGPRVLSVLKNPAFNELGSQRQRASDVAINQAMFAGIAQSGQVKTYFPSMQIPGGRGSEADVNAVRGVTFMPGLRRTSARSSEEPPSQHEEAEFPKLFPTTRPPLPGPRMQVVVDEAVDQFPKFNPPSQTQLLPKIQVIPSKIERRRSSALLQIEHAMDYSESFPYRKSEIEQKLADMDMKIASQDLELSFFANFAEQLKSEIARNNNEMNRELAEIAEEVQQLDIPKIPISPESEHELEQISSTFMDRVILMFKEHETKWLTAKAEHTVESLTQMITELERRCSLDKKSDTTEVIQLLQRCIDDTRQEIARRKTEQEEELAAKDAMIAELTALLEESAESSLISNMETLDTIDDTFSGNSISISSVSLVSDETPTKKRKTKAKSPRKKPATTE